MYGVPLPILPFLRDEYLRSQLSIRIFAEENLQSKPYYKFFLKIKNPIRDVFAKIPCKDTSKVQHCATVCIKGGSKKAALVFNNFYICISTFTMPKLWQFLRCRFTATSKNAILSRSDSLVHLIIHLIFFSLHTLLYHYYRHYYGATICRTL